MSISIWASIKRSTKNVASLPIKFLFGNIFFSKYSIELTIELDQSILTQTSGSNVH